MYQPIEGILNLATLDGQIVEYWDGADGLTNAQLVINGQWLTLPGLLCEKVADPQLDPMERIAAALERIAALLESLVSAAGNLKVEVP